MLHPGDSRDDFDSILGTLDQVFIAHLVYWYGITNFANPVALIEAKTKWYCRFICPCWTLTTTQVNNCKNSAPTHLYYLKIVLPAAVNDGGKSPSIVIKVSHLIKLLQSFAGAIVKAYVH